MLKNFKINPISKWLFLISFSLGNICLFGYLIFHEMYFAVGGLFLLFFGGILNLTTFFLLLFCAFKFKDHFKEYLNSAVLLLINIPFAVLYYYIGIYLVQLN